MVDTHKILQEVLAKYSNHPKWNFASFERVKLISNMHVGDVGQDFLKELCEKLQFKYEPSPEGKRGPWDANINKVSFEIKTATEDKSGNFQFNHVRLHRKYDALLCLGISPNDICFGYWTKGEVTTEKAGHLVTMDKGSSATWKLTKKTKQLFPIQEFEKRIGDFTKELKGE